MKKAHRSAMKKNDAPNGSRHYGRNNARPEEHEKIPPLPDLLHKNPNENTPVIICGAFYLGPWSWL